MSPIHFKLTKSDSHTRRLAFQVLPDWDALAAKLHTLFSIPVDHLAVSYLDNENDEITLSSDEELQDFYQSSYTPGSTIKFFVFDLTSTPEPAKSFAQISTPNRNTFGQDNFELIEHWHPLAASTGLAGSAVPVDSDSDAPHAFIELANHDEVNSASKAERDTGTTQTEDDKSTILAPRLDKGKGRAYSFDNASITSVVAEEPSYKYPIHVYDVSTTEPNDALSPLHETKDMEPGSQEYNSFKATVTRNGSEDPHSTNTPPNAPVDDPPLPATDFVPPAPEEVPSFTKDIATWLAGLTSTVTSNPQLGEGLRDIYRNAATGAYWDASRAAAAQFASQGAQSPALAAEVDAARKISDSVGSLLRFLASTLPPPPAAPVSVIDLPNPHLSDAPHAPTFDHSFSRSISPLHAPLPPELPPLSNPVPDQPPVYNDLQHHTLHPIEQTLSGQSQPLSTEPSVEQDARAQLEAAKQLYKEQKEHYRQQREQRRKEKEERKASKDGPPPITIPFSGNAFQSFQTVTPTWTVPKEIETITSPRRYNTHIGHGAVRRSENKSEDITTRAISRIAKRVSDMGFTANRYPDLPDMIKAQVFKNKTISQEVEDDIVTTLIESFLTAPSAQPGPSGSVSGHRKQRSDGWH